MSGSVFDEIARMNAITKRDDTEARFRAARAATLGKAKQQAPPSNNLTSQELVCAKQRGTRTQEAPDKEESEETQQVGFHVGVATGATELEGINNGNTDHHTYGGASSDPYAASGEGAYGGIAWAALAPLASAAIPIVAPYVKQGISWLINKMQTKAAGAAFGTIQPQSIAAIRSNIDKLLAQHGDYHERMNKVLLMRRGQNFWRGMLGITYKEMRELLPMLLSTFKNATPEKLDAAAMAAFEHALPHRFAVKMIKGMAPKAKLPAQEELALRTLNKMKGDDADRARDAQALARQDLNTMMAENNTLRGMAGPNGQLAPAMLQTMPRGPLIPMAQMFPAQQPPRVGAPRPTIAEQRAAAAAQPLGPLGPISKPAQRLLSGLPPHPNAGPKRAVPVIKKNDLTQYDKIPRVDFAELEKSDDPYVIDALRAAEAKAKRPDVVNPEDLANIRDTYLASKRTPEDAEAMRAALYISMVGDDANRRNLTIRDLARNDGVAIAKVGAVQLTFDKLKRELDAMPLQKNKAPQGDTIPQQPPQEGPKDGDFIEDAPENDIGEVEDRTLPTGLNLDDEITAADLDGARLEVEDEVPSPAVRPEDLAALPNEQPPEQVARIRELMKKLQANATNAPTAQGAFAMSSGAGGRTVDIGSIMEPLIDFAHSRIIHKIPNALEVGHMRQALGFAVKRHLQKGGGGSFWERVKDIGRRAIKYAHEKIAPIAKPLFRPIASAVLNKLVPDAMTNYGDVINPILNGIHDVLPDSGDAKLKDDIPLDQMKGRAPELLGRVAQSALASATAPSSDPSAPQVISAHGGLTAERLADAAEVMRTLDKLGLGGGAFAMSSGSGRKRAPRKNAPL